jgi:hypothetical protein
MTASTFLFATGIENSYPTINGGLTRIDEIEKCGHYTLRKTDFDLLDGFRRKFGAGTRKERMSVNCSCGEQVKLLGK